jgi:YjjG family noncanonical pyrimidine nucleotidase
MIKHPLSRKPLKWVFFDLDNTLWDFDGNAYAALKELFHRHQLEYHTGYQEAQFIAIYQDVNAAYWRRYEKGEVSKDVLRTARFTDTFALMGLPPALYPPKVWDEYLDICPRMTVLIPGAKECLAFMKDHAQIGILTNGFELTQKIKLAESGLDQWIDYVQSSEAFGSAKPSKVFFDAALEFAKISPDECVYIGDNWQTDVEGGMNAGILTYRYCNQESEPDIAIKSNPLFGGEVRSLTQWCQSF